MAENTTAAVARPASAEIEAAYAAIMDGVAPPQLGDPAAMGRAIMERIAQADSMAAILTPQELPSWRDLEGIPVTVAGFHLNRSTYDQGPVVYAVVDLTTLDDGERHTVTCGGQNVMLQLVKALELGSLPFDCKLISKRTSEGYGALWLVDVKAPQGKGA